MSELREEIGKIIDRLAVIYDEEDLQLEAISNEIKTLGDRLFELTGKTVGECKPFEQYWTYTSLDTIVDKILMPKIEKKGMSDEEITELIKKICDELDHPSMSEAEFDRELEILELETGLCNASDYFFYPELVGLEKNPSVEAITKKILEDKKNAVIEL